MRARKVTSDAHYVDRRSDMDEYKRTWENRYNGSDNRHNTKKKAIIHYGSNDL